MDGNTDTLARTLWGEARGEGRTGMHAVANVIITRVQNPRWWGRTIEQVCRMPSQFSCWNPSDSNRRKLLAVTTRDAQFVIALDLATLAIGGRLQDITRSADHFHARGVSPFWTRGRNPVVTIGRHIFYRLEVRA